MKVDLTIIIPSYNTRQLLRRCLESLKSEIQNSKFETEIIVVDNASSDGSAEEVKNFKSKIKNLKIIENSQNLGFSKAINQALRQVYTERSRSAQGKACLLLNSDTQVKRGTLEKVLEFEKKVGPAIIGLKLINPDGRVQPSVFPLPTLSRAIKEFWLGQKNQYSGFAPEGSKPREVEAVAGGAMLISGEVLKKVGLFDERYFMYFEDLDYCRRAARANFKIYYLPSAEVYHEHGASGRNLVDSGNQWRRLIPSSKIYHGLIKHWLISLIIRLGKI